MVQARAIRHVYEGGRYGLSIETESLLTTDRFLCDVCDRIAAFSLSSMESNFESTVLVNI